MKKSRVAATRHSLSAVNMVASMASVGLVMGACDSTAGTNVDAFPLIPIASSPAPLARSGAIALATEDTACVLDTYEVQIHCIYRDDQQTQVFGNRGQGPGEFRYTPQHMARGPAGTVGVIGMTKMAVFEPSGRLITEVSLPERVSPAAVIDSILMGEYLEMNRATGILDRRHLAIDVRTGEILSEGVYPGSMAAEADCPPPVAPSGRRLSTDLGGALRFASGSMVFTTLCRGQMFFLAHPDDESGVVVQRPFYAPEYPSPKDVERYLERCRSPAATFFQMPCESERFRSTPERYGVHYWVDDQDRLWVLTNRDREEFSYLDIYAATELVGSVRVRHRAVGFDVLRSRLAVLVERPVGPDDPDGYPDRGIDWYDISAVELEFQAPPN